MAHPLKTDPANYYQRVIDYPNGYSARVLSNGPASPGFGSTSGAETGLFEVQVMFDGELAYDTPVTGDVVGFADFGKVAEVLGQIAGLPERNARFEKNEPASLFDDEGNATQSPEEFAAKFLRRNPPPTKGDER